MIKTKSTYADPELADITLKRWYQLIGIQPKQNVLYETFSNLSTDSLDSISPLSVSKSREGVSGSTENENNN